jgi:hypothetical protein
VWPSDPERIELWPKRHDQEHVKGCDSVHDPTEHFQAGGITPMCILKDHQHRTLVRQFLHLGNERLRSSLSALLGGNFEYRITSVVCKRQHLCEQRNRAHNLR